MPGKPVQFEIPADDTTRGRRFWGSLFGWQFEESHGLFEYDVAQVDDHLGVAVTDMDPGRRGRRSAAGAGHRLNQNITPAASGPEPATMP